MLFFTPDNLIWIGETKITFTKLIGQWKQPKNYKILDF